MAGARVMVVEVNELAPRVVRWWIERTPGGALARLVAGGGFTTTALEEWLPRDLYPSQSWASFNTGVPWEQHGVFWYGDPKPVEFPLYWELAARAGRSVGVVGTLHSSPVDRFVDCPHIRFAVPDPFAGSPTSIPASLQPLQALNLRVSRQSARVASIRPSLQDLPGVVGLVRNGLRPGTTVRLAELTGRVLTGRWGRERLRAGQALLFADVFDRLVARHDTDLSVLFTNHVASAMHRYWAASFPEDWPAGAPYDQEWRDRHVGELPYAMAVLDRILERAAERCRRSGRHLVITSSMGQVADLTVDTSEGTQAVIIEPGRFLSALGFDHPYEVLPTMVPQLSLRLFSAAEAEQAKATLDMLLGSSVTASVQRGDTVTLTYRLPVVGDHIRLGQGRIRATDCGVTIQRIEDHRSGRHSAHGVLITSSPVTLPEQVDAFEVAPALLRALGVEPAAHHRFSELELVSEGAPAHPRVPAHSRAHGHERPRTTRARS